MTLHRGKIATHPEIISIRPLTREDLGMIEEKREGADRVGGVVARFRDPHHRVARLFASGLRIAEVVERSGYSYQRVSTLQADPAFQELIAKYREKVDAAFVANVDDFYDQATANMRMAERMIAERLEEADDEGGAAIPLKTLVDISGDRMDRFGYGKRQTNVNVNVDFAKQLEDAIARSGKAPKLIEASAPPQSPLGIQHAPSHPTESSSSAQRHTAPLVPLQGEVAGPTPAPRSQQPAIERRVLRRA